MGFSTGYVLVQGLSTDELLRRLGATLGDRVKEPDLVESPACLGPTVEGGWTVIGDSPGDIRDDRDLLKALGSGTTVLTGFLEEHEMYSQTELYVDGVRRWRVVSDSGAEDEAGVHITVEGTAPDTLDARIRRALERERETEGVDYQFNVPLDLIKDITGGILSGHPWGDPYATPYRELVFKTD